MKDYEKLIRRKMNIKTRTAKGMKKKAVFLGIVEMGALIGYVFAAVLFGLFLFGPQACSLTQAPTIKQVIGGVDLSSVRSDYEIVSMLRMPAMRGMNTADLILYCIIHDDFFALETQLNQMYSNSDDYWKLEIYDNEGGRMQTFEREGWEPKPVKEVPYKASSALIPTPYEDIPYANITFTITKGEKD
jgi:hypothetical protein